jgi:hypothetical protein
MGILACLYHNSFTGDAVCIDVGYHGDCICMLYLSGDGPDIILKRHLLK